MPTWNSTANLILVAGLRALVAPGVAVATLIASSRLLGVEFTEAYVALAIVTALLCWIFIGRQQARETRLYANGFELAGQIGLAWLMIVGILLLIGYATKTSDIFSRRVIFLWFASTPPLQIAVALGLTQWLRGMLTSSGRMRRAAIVGINAMSIELAKTLENRPGLGLKLHGFFDDRKHARLAHANGLRLCGTLAAVPDLVNSQRIEVVFIALPVERPQIRALLFELRDTTASVYLVPEVSLFSLIQARSHDIDGIPIIALCESPFHGISGIIKRATDVAVASVLLLLVAPLMLGICGAIALTSRGSLIFKQHRYGLNGERIAIYKFRTMVVSENGDRIVQAKRDDSRVTRIGRFLRRTSLDELPQLINVLQGRMSLVGPRPHAVAHNEQYRKLVSGYMVRHKVVPGITGLAQVNGCRGETATLEQMKRRVDYDLEYLRRWCWLLDIKILLQTCTVFFRDKQAY